MRARVASLALAVFTVFATSTAIASERLLAQASAGAMQLKVGSKKVVTVPNITRVAVSDPDVADIRVAGADQVEVTGRTAGATQLNVWKQDGQKVSFQISVTR